MTWISTILFNKATGKLKTLYHRINEPESTFDDIMMAHSLRPHSEESHRALHKAGLHHRGNSLPPWFVEALGLYVSLLNRCDFYIEHHYQRMHRLLKDESHSRAYRDALEHDKPEEAFSGMELEALRYAAALTHVPAKVTKEHITSLRESGFDQGEILEVNQVVSYFAYANRMVLGLGGNTK